MLNCKSTLRDRGPRWQRIQFLCYKDNAFVLFDLIHCIIIINSCDLSTVISHEYTNELKQYLRTDQTGSKGESCMARFFTSLRDSDSRLYCVCVQTTAKRLQKYAIEVTGMNRESVHMLRTINTHDIRLHPAASALQNQNTTMLQKT